MILFIISFLAGVLTVLAPCTLPMIPVIVGSSVGGDPNARSFKKALTIVLSLALSVILFTLLLKVSTLFINIPQAFWSYVSGIILVVFGLVSVFPEIWERIKFISKLSVSSNKLLGKGYLKQGFLGNVIIGAALGPVFSTCSPTYFVIIATVLPTSLFLGTLYLVAYAVGLALSLLVISYVGQKLIARLGGISDTHGWFRRGLGVLFIVLGIFILSGFDKKLESSLLASNIFDITKVEQKLLKYSTKNAVTLTTAPELVSPSGFVNTGGVPITLAQYRGKKVVLLDVWTYSCINCQRTIPYLNAWYEKYKDYGLEIVGLHTPEFAFEKVQKNVETAVGEFNIKYPVVLDNDYATWNAYGNHYWPRKYLLDSTGAIVYDHIGEGNYEETEREIQKALMNLAVANGTTVVIPTDIVNLSNVPKQTRVGSPEIYFGSDRNEYLGNGRAGVRGDQNFSVPQNIVGNTLYLGGTWNIAPESAESNTAGSIVFKYNAREVYMVASSKLTEGTKIVVKKDGQIVQTITVTSNKLYKLISSSESGEHTLEIVVPGAGFEAFTFTFG